MKNVTITLDEQTARWARQHAAERDVSLSRFIAELLEENMRASRDYDASMRRYLAKDPVLMKHHGRHYPRRDELHER